MCVCGVCVRVVCACVCGLHVMCVHNMGEVHVRRCVCVCGRGGGGGGGGG